MEKGKKVIKELIIMYKKEGSDLALEYAESLNKILQTVKEKEKEDLNAK